ncbi:MAG TPA: carbohydrate kinase [Chthonomonadaceae bacterium]|nr:carbohydrate kinase [Chthonomonadaceae bacterium]
MIGLGELLWDLLPAGRQLGGAPANFAYHAHALGALAWPISRVGIDALGREVLDRLGALGLPTECIQIDSEAPTGTVSVEMLPGGDHRFSIHEDVAWDRLEATEAALSLAARADAVCFGTLGQRAVDARDAVQRIAEATPPGSLRIFDVNLRQRYYSRAVIERSLDIATILKVNDVELPIIAELLGIRDDCPTALSELAARYDLNLVALTRGAAGSLLFAKGQVSDLPGDAVEIADTIGAGDAFTAALALGLQAGWDLDTVHRRAQAVATYVCTRPGATPALPAAITSPFHAG